MTENKPKVTPLMKGLLRKASQRNATSHLVPRDSNVDIPKREAPRETLEDKSEEDLPAEHPECHYYPLLTDEDYESLRLEYYERLGTEAPKSE